MKAGLCLFTDSLEPSGVGEHMLTLASELRGQYRVSFVCPPGAAGRLLIERARTMGFATLALEVRGGRVPQMSLRDRLRAHLAWMRAARFNIANEAAARLRERISRCPPTAHRRRHHHHNDTNEAAAAGASSSSPSADTGAEDAAAHLRDWLRRERIDIFHCHAGIALEGHDGIHAARLAGVPIRLRTEHLPYLPGWGAGADYKRFVEEAARLICVSSEVRASFLRIGVSANKVEMIRNGISARPPQSDRDTVRAQLGLRADDRVVLTVGRMTAQKNHHLLIGAIPAVLARVPKTHFVWVGDGPLEGELRARVRQLGLGAHVHFLGRRGDVPELLAAADLFALPSLYEGLPLVVIEAMAAALPIVGTRVCGTSEVVSDGVTGRLVELGEEGGGGDRAAFAAALLEVLEQPQAAARWGAAGRSRFEREFSAARMARETAAVYEELRGQLESAATAAVPDETIGFTPDSTAARRVPPAPPCAARRR